MRDFLTVLGMLVALTAPASGGVVYEIEVTDHEQSPPKTETMQTAVEGRQLKMAIASGDRGRQGEMIYRGDSREMVVIDHESKTYHRFDEAAMQQIAGQLDEATRMMQEALKNVPEGQREMMEKMMKERMPATAAPPARPKSELRKTGEKAEKHGYPCVKYELFVDGRKTRELWVAAWDEVDGGAEVAGAFEDMSAFVREMLDALPDFGRQTAMVDPAFEHMKDLDGFPVVSRDLADDGSLRAETVLRSAKRQTLDPDAFEPPSGYKRQEMFGPQ